LQQRQYFFSEHALCSTVTFPEHTLCSTVTFVRTSRRLRAGAATFSPLLLVLLRVLLLRVLLLRVLLLRVLRVLLLLLLRVLLLRLLRVLPSIVRGAWGERGASECTQLLRGPVQRHHGEV
jgi:hypothetical protein